MLSHFEGLREAMRMTASVSPEMVQHHWQLDPRRFDDMSLLHLSEMIEKLLLDGDVAVRKPIEPPLHTFRHAVIRDNLLNVCARCRDYGLKVSVNAHAQPLL